MPANILPRDEHVWLLVAESVRIEADGKISMFGMLGTERIQLAAVTKLPAALPLTFIFLLREGVGSFTGSFQIRDPAGKAIHEERLAIAKKPSPSENHGIAITMMPFVVPSYGQYRLTLTLDGRRYKRTFTVDPSEELSHHKAGALIGSAGHS